MSYDVAIHINAKDNTGSVLDHLDAQLQGLVDVAEILERGFKGVTAGFDRTERELELISAASRRAGDGLRKTGESAKHAAGGFKLLNSQAAQFVKGFLIHDALRLAKDGVRDLGQSFYDVNSKAETFMVTLETMYGSLAKAEQKYAEFERFAQKTPFNFADVGEQAIRLKAYGLEPTTKLLTTIGDTTAAFGGNKDILNGIVRALGQMQTKGKAAAQELRQLAEWGVPAYEILQQKLGLTAEQVQEIGKHGIDSSRAVRALLEGLDERFGGQMEALRDKAQGITGEIGDLWFQIMKRVGDAGAWQPVKDALADVRDWMQDAIDTGKVNEWASRVTSALVDIKATAESLAPIMLALANLAGYTAQLAAGTARGVSGMIGPAQVGNDPGSTEGYDSFAGGDEVVRRWGPTAPPPPPEAVEPDYASAFAMEDEWIKTEVSAALKRIKGEINDVQGAAGEAMEAIRKLVQGDFLDSVAPEEQSGVYAVFPDLPRTADELEREYKALKERLATVMRTGGVTGEWATEEVRSIREAMQALRRDMAETDNPFIDAKTVMGEFLLVEQGIEEVRQGINAMPDMTIDVSQPLIELTRVANAIQAVRSAAARPLVMGTGVVEGSQIPATTGGQGNQYAQVGSAAEVDAALAERIKTGRSETGMVMHELVKHNVNGPGYTRAQFPE